MKLFLVLFGVFSVVTTCQGRGFCEGKHDGDYADPKGCYGFIRCTSGKTYYEDCRSTVDCSEIPTGKLGSLENPAPSCKAIFDNNWSAPPSDSYILLTGTQKVTKVYCYMEDIPGCGGGGWTTVMKTDGNLPKFIYDSDFWTNKKAFNVKGGQSGADDQQTKHPTYWTTPFTKLCLGMKTGSTIRWLRVDHQAPSLYSQIVDNKYRSLSVGDDKWKSLIPDSSLQKNCNKEGFNVKPARDDYDKVRIGIVSNEENDCITPDSRIGFGGAGWTSGSSGSKSDYFVSTGNKTSWEPDNGNKVIKTFGYILVQ